MREAEGRFNYSKFEEAIEALKKEKQALAKERAQLRDRLETLLKGQLRAYKKLQSKGLVEAEIRKHPDWAGLNPKLQEVSDLFSATSQRLEAIWSEIINIREEQDAAKEIFNSAEESTPN